MNRCEDCKYYVNNYGYGQCFGQKNAPRVDYNRSCENFKAKSEIDLSFWNMDRIQREQDKHITPYAINPIDKNRLDEAIMKDLSVVDSLNNEINAYMRKVQEQSDMYRICEIAKLYIESQRPAEWINEYVEYMGMKTLVCSECHYPMGQIRDCFCANCGRRMKHGT